VLESNFEAGAKVTPEALEEAGLIRDSSKPVKVLGDGEVTKKLDVEAAKFSTSAAMKITKAGGNIKTVD
ncbi:MAG: uL15 family ribosomal protein, partial [Planctomycetota bacterium]